MREDEMRIFNHAGKIVLGDQTKGDGESVHAVLQGKIRARTKRGGIGTAEFALPDAWIEDIMGAHVGKPSGYGYYIVRVKA